MQLPFRLFDVLWSFEFRQLTQQGFGYPVTLLNLICNRACLLGCHCLGNLRKQDDLLRRPGNVYDLLRSQLALSLNVVSDRAEASTLDWPSSPGVAQPLN